MATAFSNATLLINNETIAYMANSLKFVEGQPEKKVDPQVIGGGAVTNVVTQDFSTAKSKVMFDLKTTSENQTIISTWESAFDQNLIKIISSNGTTTVFENTAIINQPEFDAGVDGVISIEFEGAQSVFG